MKPTLLLHSCCAPCSSSVIEKLNNYYDLTVFYYNPNIFPKKEYEKRLAEQNQYLEKIGIPLITGEFENKKYLEAMKEYSNQKERDFRCYVCYKFRLEKTAEIAKQKKFDFFTTTLSVSPHKNAKWINEIGQSLEAENCKFLVADFKKENGYFRSLELSKQNNFYRQNYCGCEISFNANQYKLDKK